MAYVFLFWPSNVIKPQPYG